MNPLRWLVELVDKISGPAGKITRSLRETSGGMAELRSSMAPLGGEMGAAEKTGRSFTQTLKSIGSGLFFVAKAALVLGGLGFFKELPRVLAAFRAGSAARGLKGVGDGLRSAFGEGGQALTRMGQRFFRLTGARIALVGGGLLVAGAAAWGLKKAFDAVLGVVTGVVSAVGSLVYRFSQAVMQAQIFRDQNIAALATITRSQSQGLWVADEIRALAHFMGTDLLETARSIQSLMAGGFTKHEAFQLFQSISDLRVLDPDASADHITRAIRQIRSKGVLQMEELQQQLADSGVDVGDVISRIGENLGISADQVRSRITAGQVSAALGIQAIMESIQARAGGGPIGALARERSLSLPGLLQRLKNAPAIIFDAIAAQSDAAFGGVRELLLDILDLLDPSSAKFKAMIAVLSSGFDAVVESLRTAWAVGRAFFEGLVGQKGDDAIQSIRTMLLDVGKALASLRDPATLAWFRRLGAFLGPIIKGFGVLVGILSMLVGYLLAVNLGPLFAIVAAVSMLIAAVMDIVDKATEWGGNIVDGLIGGITGALSRLREAATGMATTVRDAIVNTLKIGSPSRVTEELGEWTGAGFGIGLDRSMPDLDGAFAVSVTGDRGGGGGVVLNGPLLQVEVRGEGGDPEGIAEAIRRIALPELESAFEELAIQLGVA